MINQRSIQAVSGSVLEHGFIKPQYNSYCFSQIPNTLLKLLGAGSRGLPDECIQSGTYERVIFILVDGFGWKFLEQHQGRYPFLNRFFEQGVVSKLTSQFPSTTAAHITTLCSNQVVGEHGVYEWFMYEPLVERVIAPLLYTYAGDKKVGSLADVIGPDEIFPQGFFFKELQKHGIPCTIFQTESIANSIYSKWMFEGAKRVGYNDWPHALTLLKEHLHSPGLFYLYFGDFDTEAHHHGVNSPACVKALDRCFHALEASLKELPASTALVMTADHGMIDINPLTTVYLNQRFPTLAAKLKKGSDGHALAPAGSCRDFFLHVEPNHLMDVFKELQEALHESAWVCLTSELIERGFFGPNGISSRCQNRLGNIALIAKGSNSFWWYEKGRFEQTLHAMHGGLTPDELETIFLFLKSTP